MLAFEKAGVQSPVEKLWENSVCSLAWLDYLPTHTWHMWAPGRHPTNESKLSKIYLVRPSLNTYGQPNWQAIMEALCELRHDEASISTPQRGNTMGHTVTPTLYCGSQRVALLRFSGNWNIKLWILMVSRVDFSFPRG